MGRDVDLTDGGIASFFEDRANGLNAATMHAPAVLAGSYDVELLDALPGGLEFITIDAAGKLATSAGSSGDLQAAYDSGGPGLGRAIVADNGAVTIDVSAAVGNAGLEVTQADDFNAVAITKSGVGAGVLLDLQNGGTGITANIAKTAAVAGTVAQISDAGTGISLAISKTGASGNLISCSGGGGTLVWTGTQLDLQGDVAGGVLSVLSLDVGTNPVIVTGQFGAGVALHVDNSGNAFPATIRLESGAGVTDCMLEFHQNSVQRWELGYDQSAGGFALGRLTFANPTIFAEDTTGDVGINELTPDAKLHVTAGASLVALIEATVGTAQLNLRDSASSDENQVGISAVGDDLQLMAGGNVFLHMDAALQRIGIGDNTPSAKLDVMSNVSAQITVFLNQDHAAGRNLVIDSESTAQPLIELLALASTNVRGDIALTQRTASASNPSEADIWYDATNHRAEYYEGLQVRAFGTRFGPNFGPEEAKTISGGVITATSGHMVVDGEGSVSDTLDTITVTGAGPKDGDLILIRSIGAGVTITVSDGGGNIRLNGGANFAMNTVNDTLTLMWAATQSLWIEQSSSNNTV